MAKKKWKPMYSVLWLRDSMKSGDERRLEQQKELFHFPVSPVI